MYLKPDAVSVVLLVGSLRIWLKWHTRVWTPFISLSEETKEAKQAAYAETDAALIWFPLRKPIFGWLTNVRLLIQVVNLFNMFITYGDTFLPTSNSYDELYYEIVRMHQVFDNLYCMGMLVESALKPDQSCKFSFESRYSNSVWV